MYNKQLIKEYYLWLLSLVDNGETNYSKITWVLFNTEFTWLVSNDANRASDGKNLRYEYVHVYHGKEFEGFDLLPVNCLEVLIALAINWEHEITYDYTIGDRSAQWFWLMLDNLGLLEYPDEAFDLDEVSEIVSIWLNREYQKNGYGNIFQAKTDDPNWSKKEIWLQLQDFVLKNMFI